VLQRVRLRGACQHLARPRLRQLERVARDPLDPLAREDAGLLGQLVWRTAVQAAAHAAVLPLGVLAHADHVDVGGAAVGERRADAGHQAHRPQVHVLPEPLPQRQDQLARRDRVRHARVADRAEIDRVELQELVAPVGVEHLPLFEVVVAAPGDVGEIQLEAVVLGGHLEHLDASGDDFLADAVAGDDCDAMRLHAVRNLRRG
jgi:hypothetical protein